MRIVSLASIVIALILLNLLGCRSAPIQNVQNVAVTIKKADYTIEDVEKVILRAGDIASWKMEIDKPGAILATYYGPTEEGRISYSASVTIAYTRASYSIEYRNSTENIRYSSGKIHENYNVWVKDLDSAIRREMLAY
jgi:hypothetical protein